MHSNNIHNTGLNLGLGEWLEHGKIKRLTLYDDDNSFNRLSCLDTWGNHWNSLFDQKHNIAFAYVKINQKFRNGIIEESTV